MPLGCCPSRPSRRRDVAGTSPGRRRDVTVVTVVTVVTRRCRAASRLHRVVARAPRLNAFPETVVDDDEAGQWVC